MDMHWRDKAACLGEDPELFFYPVPLRIDRKPSRKQVEIFKTANIFCSACTVKQECLADASEDDRRNMVRGGMMLEFSQRNPDEARKNLQRRIDAFIEAGACLNGHEIRSQEDLDINIQKSGHVWAECTACRKERNKKYSQARRDKARAAKMEA